MIFVLFLLFCFLEMTYEFKNILTSIMHIGLFDFNFIIIFMFPTFVGLKIFLIDFCIKNMFRLIMFLYRLFELGNELVFVLW